MADPEQEPMDPWATLELNGKGWPRQWSDQIHPPVLVYPADKVDALRYRVQQEIDAHLRERDAQIASLSAQVEQWERQKHDANCELRGPGGAVERRCSCGFRALRAELATLRAERDAAQQQIATLTAYKAAFEELYATVQGECPSLLDPCRGGSDVLWNLCAAALQSTRPQEQP